MSIPGTAEPRVSVVIRCRNEEQHIGRLLAGILEQSVREADIVVVDSGSTDATLSIVDRFPVRLVRIRPQEFSFGRALNRGFEIARGEVVVAASAHVYPVYRDWLARLLEPFDDPQVALVYGKQRGDDRTRYSEARVFATWFPDTSDLNQSHPFCNNANAAVRRAVWERLPYDETLTGLEDVDWAQRAMRAGYRIAYVAGAEIIHVHEEGARDIFNRYRREAMALARIQPTVRFGLLDFLRLASSSLVSDIGHAWREGHPGAVRDIAVFRLMQFWGTYRGFREPGAVTIELKRRFYYPQGWPRDDGDDPREDGDDRARIDYARVSGTQETDG
jgi:glycosyltransferase involved in cell wall biosynthesis